MMLIEYSARASKLDELVGQQLGNFFRRRSDIPLKQPFLQFAEHRRILGLLSHPHCLCLSCRLGPFTSKRQVTDQLVSNSLPAAVVVFDRVSRLIDVTDGTSEVDPFNAARCWARFDRP